MLQQILDDMYIDPELLAELDEEQKQILFCKMREEQVRRWKMHEDELGEEDKKMTQPKKNGGKKVTFLVGVDGEPMVVVLGGGEDVDSILEERAKRQADLEDDFLKKAAEEELDKLVRLSRSTVEAMEEEATRNNNKDKVRDPAREAVVMSLQEATVEMEGQIQALEEAESRQRNKKENATQTNKHKENTTQTNKHMENTAKTNTEISTQTNKHMENTAKTNTEISTQTNKHSENTVLTNKHREITTQTNTEISTESSSSSSTSSSSSSPSSSLSSLSTSSVSTPQPSPPQDISSASSLSSLSSSSSSPPSFTISSYGNNSTTKKLSGLSIWEGVGSNPIKTQIKPVVLSSKPTITNSVKPNPPPLSSSSSSSLHSSPPPSLSPSFPSPLTIVEKDERPQLSATQTSHSTVVGVAAQIRRFEQLCEGSIEALKTATLERARRRRQREILEQLRSQVEAARTMAPVEGDHKAWQEQERKAKEAERRIREIARRAREEHRRAANSNPPSQTNSPATTPTHSIPPTFPPQNGFHSPNSPNPFPYNTPSQIQLNANQNGYSQPLSAQNGFFNSSSNSQTHGSLPNSQNANQNGFRSPSVINGDINGNIKSPIDDFSNNNRGCIRQRVRPPKPPSRDAIVTWFREEELSRGAGLDPSRSNIAPWFHGIISRTEAEEVLSGSGIGCFLVRVSERIWGYAISYKGPDRCRHYLIDVTGGRYTFFGSHQAAHTSLSDLVEYHKHEVITVMGGELLTRPCVRPKPLTQDFIQLFKNTPYLPS